MLVGRDVLLAAGEAALSGALEGRGRLLLLAGEAGIGKTALATAIADAGARSGALVRAGACWESEGLPPFTPWIDALRRPGDDACALVARRLEGVDAPGATDAAAAQRARVQLFGAVVDGLHEEATRRPQVVVLEDLHWADRGSLELLTATVAHLPRMPVLLIGTYRGDELPSSGPLASIGGNAERLSVTGLDSRSVADLLTSVLGRPATEDEARAVHRQTAGNPLFVTQVARLLGAGSKAVPLGVQDVLARRLARLSARCSDVLGAAAVLGTEFDAAVLADVVGGPVDQALDEAARAGLAVPAADDPSRWSFLHALVASTCYDALPSGHRAVLHGRAAEALERRPATSASALVHHAVRGRFEDDDRPARILVAAGHEALDQMAWADAEDLFQRATALATDSPSGPEICAEAWLGIGAARLRRGEGDVRAAFDSAASLSRDLGRVDLLGRAALGFGVGLGAFEVQLVDHHQIELLQEAAAALPEGQPLLPLVLARLSVALAYVDTQHRRSELATRSVELARANGDPLILGHCLSAFCDAIAGPDHVDERLAASEEVVTLAARAGDLPLELLGRRHRVMALLERVDVTGADREISAYTRAADAIGDPLYTWYAALWQGMRSQARGDRAAARAHIQEARRIGRLGSSGNSALLALVFDQMAGIDERDGPATQRATEAIIRALPDLGGPYVALMQALIAATFSDQDTVEALLGSIVPAELDDLPRDSEWLATLSQLALAAPRAGRTDLAAHARKLLEPYAGLGVIEGIGASARGTVDRFLAVAAGIAGDAREARRHVDAALLGASRLGALVEACTALDGAWALRMAGDQADSARIQELARRAGSGFTALGLDAPAREAASLGADSTPRSEQSSDDSLQSAVRREGDAWAWTWDGQTVRVRHAKGMADLAVLLEQAGREVHVRELEGVADRRAGGNEAPALDAEAVSQYRRRLVDLEEDLEEAERHADLARAGRLAAERDALVTELTRSFGIGARRRRAGSDPDERLRKAVSARVRASIDRIDELNPALGRHLRASVRTGFWCSYQPERPTSWDVSRR